MKVVRGGIESVPGFTASGIACGIKKNGKRDLALIVSETICSVAGVFTKNRIQAAPVLWCKKIVKSGKAKAILINSGNANACTGAKGFEDCETMARVAGEALSIPENRVLVCSTGVIGEMLPIDVVTKGIRTAPKKLRQGDRKEAAEAIMTTDTFPKRSAVECSIQGKKVRIGGMGKGSGMIFPQMATMLAFITTDLAISPQLLKKALREVSDTTFNMITVDGDSSTNDTVLLMANGKAANKELTETGKDFTTFCTALKAVCSQIAEHIVKDGEGATKLIQITVEKAKSVQDARKVAMTIANSNLVKTAIFGADPNWGRIIMAAGNAGVPVNFYQMDLFVGEVEILNKGVQRDPKWEKKVEALLKKKRVSITLRLNNGKEKAEALTCDMTYDYIKINASYRT